MIARNGYEFGGARLRVEHAHRGAAGGGGFGGGGYGPPPYGGGGYGGGYGGGGYGGPAAHGGGCAPADAAHGWLECDGFGGVLCSCQ